jgi:hypothetical protein
VSVRRRSKLLVLAVAVLGLALVLSACAFIKEGSLNVSQPAGIGSARVHFVLCTESGEGACKPNRKNEPPQGNETIQYLIGIAVPKGATAPATFTAQPITPGTQPITFTRNDQVASEIAASSAKLAEAELSEEEEEAIEIKPWPPAGLEGVGYLSGPVEEEEGSLDEWGIDADFGLPVPSDGSPFTGPFATGIAEGAREITPEHPASAPVHCFRFEGGSEEGDAICSPTVEEAQVGTADLRIAALSTAPVYVGGKASLPFGLNFGSTANAPSFNVTATSTLPGAAVTVSAPSFTPPAVDPGTHRSSGTETVTVAVPPTAQPGVYEVTITAKTAAGGSVSQVAKFEVTKPVLKLGKAKLNKKKGTAKLAVGVPSAGTLTISGKGIVKVQRKPTGPATLKVTIKAKGKAKKKLTSTGKAKVKAKVVFQPANGAAVTAAKKITLKKKLP